MTQEPQQVTDATPAGLKRFTIPVTCYATVGLTHEAESFGLTFTDALTTLIKQVEDESLDWESVFEDDNSGLFLPYYALTGLDDASFEIDETPVEGEELDDREVLVQQVKELSGQIRWTEDALEKHRVFLESLVTAA